MNEILLGIIGVILIIISYFMGAPETKTGGAKNIKDTKDETTLCVVGERDAAGNYGQDYNARFEFLVLSRDEFIREELSRGYLFDKYNVIAAWPYARDEVVDVGANIGTFCIPISRQAHVTAYEPQRAIYALLRKNIARNGAAVTALKMAAGHRAGRANMSATVPDGAAAGQEITKATTLVNYGGINLGEAGESCRMTTLDDAFRGKMVSVIKVDVEGAEPLVFYGARKLLKRTHPVIILERNVKTVTPEMITAMRLLPEHVTFDPFRYCRDVGYTKMIVLPKQNYMLVHPDRWLTSEESNYEPAESQFGFETYTFKKIKW